MENSELSDLDRELPASVRIVVGNLTLAWGAYDSAITYWLAKTLGTTLDVASIMFGSMDIDTKLLRLQRIHEHFGQADAAKGLKKLRDAHEQRKEARNIIAHSRCVGRSRKNPDDIAFSAVWHVKNEPGFLALKLVSVTEILLSTAFATETYHEVMALAAEMPVVVEPAHPDQ